MKKTLNKSDAVLRFIEVALSAIILVFIGISIFNISGDKNVSGVDRLEKAIRDAAVTCYTEEGVYPPNIDYIKDNYGVLIDENKFTVHYTAYADNLMPVITVTEKNG